MTFLTRLGLFGCVATLAACSSVENRAECLYRRQGGGRPAFGEQTCRTRSR